MERPTAATFDHLLTFFFLFLFLCWRWLFVFFFFLFFSFLGLAVQFLFFYFFYIILALVSWVLKKKKFWYRLTGARPMNSVKKLSDENKSDVAKWVWKNELWVMSDELWVMEIEWRKLSDEKCLPKQALNKCGLCLCTNFLSRYDNGRGKEKRLQWFLTKDE